MIKSIIWNVSKGKKFPLDVWKHNNFSLHIENVDLEKATSLDLRKDSFNIVFLQIDSKSWKSIKKSFTAEYETNPLVNLILVLPEDELGPNEKEKGSYLILEQPLHERELRWVIEKSLLSEIYKQSSIEISQNCLANFSFFEGLFELAKQENKTKDETIKAMEKILEFEKELKINQDKMGKAMDHVNDMRNMEMMQLHERIKANEILDEFRENELKEAIALKEATEKALQFSREEEITQDKIIKAQEKIFEYTDREYRELLEENKELKKRLGITD
jgi:hypothetical protein